tara:strand:+ start:5316 stop:8150 length:2835 start_codon:yes stop_codon:yes gene_type:complete
MKSFHKVLNITVSILAVILYFQPVPTYAVELTDQTILLTPETPLITKTLVTLGIPFAPGQLKDISQLRIYDEVGDDVAIFTKPTLYWHWKKKPNNTIRAVKVQFYLNKGSEVTTYSFTYNSSRNLNSDLNERLYDIGTQVSDNPNKAGMRSPFVIPIVKTAWLEQSQIIPPFKGMNNDNQMIFWDKQFSWGRELDFTRNIIANWLFDRVSALYKGCMRTSEVDCYREAFLSYRFWNKHIKRSGDLSSCRGGLDIDSSPRRACDNKYVYIEPIKIHVALTGDDSLHDDQLIKDMSELVYDNSWQGSSYDLYDKEDEVFTERHTGLSLLTLINGYELVSDSTILSYVNKHIESLYQHQNNNPDGLSPDGSFRHSWRRHEGNTYLGNGNFDDRRFSPWMMENITDALWQAHFIIEDKRIPEMIRFSGEALELWGFANSQGYIDKFGSDLHSLPNGESWRRGCNKNGDVILYSGSSKASSEALIATQRSNGWYSDSHTSEAIFTLAVAYYFEKNIDKANALKKRITKLHDTFLKNCGGGLSYTKRAFNWSNRSNYWGTYLWVLSEKGEELPTSDFDGSIPDNSNTVIKEPLREYTYSYFDEFEGYYQADWLQNNQWFIINNGLQAEGYSLLALGDNIDAGNDYRIELNLTLSDNNMSDKSILFGNQTDTFYTARFITGVYGGVYLYKHFSKWDMSGKVIASKLVNLSSLQSFKLVTVVKSKNVKVYLNDILQINFTNNIPFTGRGNGVFSQGGSAIVDSFLLGYEVKNINDDGLGDVYSESMSFDFFMLDIDFWQENDWIIDNQNINIVKSGQLLLKDIVDLGSHYSIEGNFGANNNGQYGINILFNNSINEYYTARIYPGQWGGVYLYKHVSVWDVGGKTIARNLSPLLDSSYILKVITKDKLVYIYLNDELLITHEFDNVVIGKNMGLHTLGNITDVNIHDITISY